MGNRSSTALLARRAAAILGLLLCGAALAISIPGTTSAQDFLTPTPEGEATQPETNTIMRVEINAPDQPVAIGEEFTGNLLVENVEHLAGFSATVVFDPEKLEAVRVENEGEFLTTGERQDMICDESKITLDTVSILCNTFGPPVCLDGQTGADGSGSLGTITFRSKGGGPTTLEIETASLAADDVAPPCDIDQLQPIEIPHRGEETSVDLAGGGGGGPFLSTPLIGVIVVAAVVVVGAGGYALYNRRRSSTGE